MKAATYRDSALKRNVSPPSWIRGVIANTFHRREDLIHCRPGLIQKSFTGFREMCAAGGAREQRYAHTGFELLNDLANRRRRYV